MTILTNDLRIYVIGSIVIFDILAIGLGFSIIISLRLGLYIYAIFLLPYRTFRNNQTNFFIVSLIILILFLSTFNSSYIPESIDSGIKTSLSLFMGIFAYHSIRSIDDIKLLSKFFFISLVLSLLIILFSNLFKFGEINYYDSSIMFGASGVNIVKSITLYMILSLPYLIFRVSPSKLLYLVYFFAILVVMLATKRSAMLVVIMYLAIFLLLNLKSIKSVIIPLCIGLPIGYYFFSGVILDRLENRSERFDVSNPEELEKEWRLIESQIAIDNFSDGSYMDKLLGIETFNEVSGFNLRYMFHNDFAVLLGSLGLFGLILYLSIFISFIFFYIKFIVPSVYNIIIFKWLYICLVISLIVFGISGNFKFLGGTLSTCLIGLGALQGFYTHSYENSFFRRYKF